MRFGVVVAALAVWCGAAQAKALQDGGFETPIAPSGSLTRFSTGQAIGPWTVVGASGTVDLITSTFTYEGFSFPAHGGNQWLDLTGVSNSATGVSQTVSTKKGKSYQLSFWVGNVYAPNSSDLGVTSTVLVMVDGKQVMKAVNKNANGTSLAWKMFTLTLTATKPKTVITFINGDPSNDTCNGIDDVVLEPAP